LKQQQRISQGMDSGQLTAGESANLEKKESNINTEERTMLKDDNGHLSAADRAKLQQQQNQVSKQIYGDKHNRDQQVTQPTTEVGKRDLHQQQRIAQGVKSGQLTAGEADKLENKETAINHEVAADRAANGGKLTAAERQQINNQQSNVSKKIYGAKHNNHRQSKKQ